MKMFSDCSGECFACTCSGFCIAGHGDDNFCHADVNTILQRYYSETNWLGCKKEIKEYLKNKYAIDVPDIDFKSKQEKESAESIEKEYIENSLENLWSAIDLEISKIVSNISNGEMKKENIEAMSMKLNSLKNTIENEIDMTTYKIKTEIES